MGVSVWFNIEFFQDQLLQWTDYASRECNLFGSP